MHDRRFEGDIARLRAPERVALLEVARVVDLCLEGITVRRALDVGTGSGIFAEAFAARGLAVAGVDVNPDMLPVALGFVPGGEFHVAPAEALPFGDGTFDLVYLGHVLHETDDPVQALAEARRVATARVAVLEWPYLNEEKGPPLAHRLSPARVAELARAAGFGAVRQPALGHMALFLMDR